MSMIRRLIIVVLATLSSVWLAAQSDPLVEALRKYQAGDLAAARTLIDEAVRLPAHVEDAEAWLLRGFVYKDIFKGATDSGIGDLLRDEALASLYTSIGLDTAGSYRENAAQAYDFLARSYFNDAAKALNDMDHERALAMFAKYKEATYRKDPEADLRSREVEFINALGTVYTKLFNMERKDTAWFEMAVGSYRLVLELDPENYGANYNLATLYYNRGVYNIQRINADDEIPSILEIQSASREFFQQALPFMLKAHDMNPERRETLLGLEGIYYSLQDQNNSDKFRQLFEEIAPEER
ncbi:MAG: hypothetical protein IPH05_00755 [Flavobacteriales bacterium]|jgi:hypothetical protein|nr:hypothetical protein [Flavobacteriales bacterium]MBP9176755.1 hypothetical protein [Flavobacteriales bacterium]MCC6911559.1 hypothetical protein [Flavobacteriales bacterium]HQW04908.1 hypothetical protein [Flavobacteriales bacterium]HQW98077.1 hypothetical protein [Flavobacteriales bacterium]